MTILSRNMVLSMEAEILILTKIFTPEDAGTTDSYCLACRTYEIATRFWEVVICPIYMCLTVYEFSFILFDLCLFIAIFNFILNYVLIVTFWIFTYPKIWIMLIIYCFIWNYWIFYFVTCLEVICACHILFWALRGASSMFAHKCFVRLLSIYCCASLIILRYGLFIELTLLLLPAATYISFSLFICNVVNHICFAYSL